MIVRADLPRGIQAANIVHAAVESSPGNLPRGTYAVCLVTPGEPALRGLAERLIALGVPHVAIHESDEPYSGQLMAVGLKPARKEDVRRLLSSLPLLR